jgi:hypothetical protein
VIGNLWKGAVVTSFPVKQWFSGLFGGIEEKYEKSETISIVRNIDFSDTER